MNAFIRSGLFFSIITLSAACGGGGGDGDDATNISGIWAGALTKVSDQCTPSSPQTINVRHSVSQNEDAVTLFAESGVQFVGNTVGENGFSVDATHSTIGNSRCNDTSRIAYDSINNDSDPTGDIDLTINRSCPGAAVCTIQYTGTVSRAGFVVSTPTPGVGPTPTVAPGTTPVAGGCPAINPATASGAYEGDGGCGISTVSFRYANDTVVLEPFGANGATSFNVSSANISSASSARTDLSINAESGYSCSMVCSAPGTFTVQCFKEGGTTCVEKF